MVLEAVCRLVTNRLMLLLLAGIIVCVCVRVCAALNAEYGCK